MRHCGWEVTFNLLQACFSWAFRRHCRRGAPFWLGQVPSSSKVTVPLLQSPGVWAVGASEGGLAVHEQSRVQELSSSFPSLELCRGALFV